MIRFVARCKKISATIKCMEPETEAQEPQEPQEALSPKPRRQDLGRRSRSHRRRPSPQSQGAVPEDLGRRRRRRRRRPSPRSQGAAQEDLGRRRSRSRRRPSPQSAVPEDLGRRRRSRSRRRPQSQGAVPEDLGRRRRRSPQRRTQSVPGTQSIQGCAQKSPSHSRLIRSWSSRA